MKVKLFQVKNCAVCPNHTTRRTQGAGYAIDFICKGTGKVVAGYVEWNSEMPKDGIFPEWCPLKGKNE